MAGHRILEHGGRTYAAVSLELGGSTRPLRLVSTSEVGFEGGRESGEPSTGQGCVGFVPGVDLEAASPASVTHPGAWVLVPPDDPRHWVALVELSGSFTIDLSFEALTDGQP